MKFLKIFIVLSSTCIQKNSNRYAVEHQMIHFEVFEVFYYLVLRSHFADPQNIIF